jgi:hypothetical protein
MFDKEVDAERHLTTTETSKLKGAYIDPKAGRTTVGEYYRTWLVRQSWRNSSRLSVTSLFENHVLPGLGGHPLNALTRGAVETWAARLPLSGQTVAQACRYLSTMLDAAVDDGLIASNPTRRARRPKVASGTLSSPSPTPRSRR